MKNERSLFSIPQCFKEIDLPIKQNELTNSLSLESCCKSAISLSISFLSTHKMIFYQSCLAIETNENKKMCSFVAFTLDQFAGAFNHRIFESRNSRLIIILCTSLTVHEKTHPSVSPFDSHTNTRRRLFFVQFRRNPLLNLTLEKSHSFPHSKKISDDKPKNSRHTQTQLFCKRN